MIVDGRPFFTLSNKGSSLHLLSRQNLVFWEHLFCTFACFCFCCHPPRRVSRISFLKISIPRTACPIISSTASLRITKAISGQGPSADWTDLMVPNLPSSNQIEIIPTPWFKTMCSVFATTPRAISGSPLPAGWAGTTNLQTVSPITFLTLRQNPLRVTTKWEIFFAIARVVSGALPLPVYMNTSLPQTAGNSINIFFATALL